MSGTGSTWKTTARPLTLSSTKDVWRGLQYRRPQRDEEYDIVKIICKELGKPESLITYVEDRKGHDMRYAIDPTKIHNELGWAAGDKICRRNQEDHPVVSGQQGVVGDHHSGEYQNYMRKCTETGRRSNNESICDGCGRTAWA